MTDEELAAIEARVRATTPGPWGVTHYSGGLSFHGPATVHAGIDEEFGEPLSIPSRNNKEDDAAFIAHARTDIPALLAEVRRLRTLVADQDPDRLTYDLEEPHHA